MDGRINGYEITEQLYESGTTLVYRGRRPGSAESLILKILKPDAATRDERARFRREFEMTSNLNIPGVVKVFGLEEYKDGLIMVMENIGGRSLDLIPEEDPLPLTEFLEIAMILAETLGSIHGQQIIHKSITPSNIVWNRDIKRLNLIDFGIADEAPERTVSPQPPSILEGTLVYISPEQTGRMNRPVDYRTDFYSLGVTFYQMLTGRLPFEADDALGMVHSHIAGTPTVPHLLCPEIPEMISLIVMKLMAKMADDRYRSAWGLKADLEKCLRELTHAGAIQPFELGVEDFSDQLRFPQKLYGREKEIDRLRRAFDRVTEGTSELFLVAGYAGVGKTALVHEMHKPVAEKHGYFIEGKFDQLQRNVPYFAWIQAFRGVVDALLMESEPRIAQWKQTILNAAGGIGKVLTDAIPNLELIIGPQPAVPELGGVEAQNRFNYVFLEFMKALGGSEHSLVVFLDDLQWVDAASLNLIETLMLGSEASNILIIGAYRDNELDALHPLTKAIEALQKKEAKIAHMKLENISVGTMNELIADTLRCEYSETTELAHLIYSKTGGNPFFLRQTLRNLVEKGSIFFDISSRQWKWDISILEGMDITDNVVDLMLGKIRLLSPETQRILPLAACIGFTFNRTNLGIIAEQPEEAVMAGLRPALREGLVVPIGDEFKFVHDRVQQAAYSLIPAKEKKQVHLKIGRLLLKYMCEHDQEAQLFAVADHFNIGAELLKDRNDRLESARLNLRAGVKARDSAAFSAAAKYFDAGVAMLDDESWQADYDLALELHSRAADAESLVGGVERTDQLFDIVTANAKTAVDMVGSYESKIFCYISQGRIQEALDTALRILEKLGLRLQAYPSEEDIDRAMQEAKSLYADTPIEDLINLPKMTNPNKLAIARIATKINAAAYNGRPGLHLLIVPNEVILSIKYGNAIESPYFYAAFALVLCGFHQDYDTGNRFGNLTLALLETTDSLLQQSKTLDVIGAHVWYFRQHLRTTLPYLEAGYQSGLKVGDLEYAGYNANFYCRNSYFAGTNLRQLEREMNFYGEAMIRMRAAIAHRMMSPYWQAVKNLLSPSGNPCLLAGKVYNHEEMLPVLEKTQNKGGLAAYYVSKLMLCYLFEEYEQAIESAELANQNKVGMTATFAYDVATFYDSLTCIQIFPNKSPLEQAQFSERVSDNQRELKHLADSAPMNYLHKFCLVEAERMRLAGDGMAALDYYDKAISLAREHGYIQEEALANELAGKFWLGKDKEDIARLYMVKAHNCYESWGAVRKVRDLEERYSNLLPPRPHREMAGAATEQLDVATLIKATQTISSEIEMDRLAQTLLRIVMENAGATKGSLFVEGGDTFLAVMTPGEDNVPGINFESVRVVGNVPDGIFNYVRHTRETVILEDAQMDAGGFSGDEYLKRAKPKSVLCVPMQRKGRLLGVLYLENNLATRVFTPERRTMIEVLAAQAAVSLETSGLYETVRANEIRLRLGQEAAHIGAWEYDIVSKRIWGSDETKRIYGFDPDAEDFSVETVESCILERERVHQAAVDLIENNRPYDLEFEIRPADGSGPKIISSVAELYRDEQDRPVKVYGLTEDITERKKLESAIERGQALFAQAEEVARSGSFDWDLRTNTATWSPGMHRLFEIPVEQFSGDPGTVLNVVHPDDVDILVQAMQVAITEKKLVSHTEYRIVLPSGIMRHIWAQGSLVQDEHGNATRMIGVCYDITERKQAEAEVERLKNHLANIIDSMPTMLVGMDNHDRITRWNRQVETDTGIPASDAVGRPVQQLFPELASYIKEMTREIRQHRPAVLERRPVEKAGERRLYDLMLYPLLSNGMEGAVLRIEDVTERSRIQEMMIQNEKMMSLGGLAAGVAHEINNPLGIISQAAQNIERRVSTEIPANLTAAEELGVDIAVMKAYFEKRRIYDFIGNIRDASLRASRIIQNILRFSRGTENILKPTSPASILDQALELSASDYDLKKKYDFKSIEIVRDNAPDIPDVPMIAVELEQVILNLLKNAAQAMALNPPDRKPRMTIRLRREDRYVLIEVEDNGPGMTEEVRRRVFEPFFTTKEPGIGTGLGLSVSYMIITQNLRGMMEAVSTPGQGACFRVRLPLAKEDIHEESLHCSGD